jgi:hypothetical protein
MLKVRIELEGGERRWRVNDTYVNYDDERVEQLGPIDRWLDYEDAIKEAKRWTMMQIRQKGRRENEDDIGWNVSPEAPPRDLESF